MMDDDELIQSSPIQTKYTSTGRQFGYTVDLYHRGLGEHKHLSAIDDLALSGKMHNQSIAWKKRYERELTRQQQQGTSKNGMPRSRQGRMKAR